MQLIQLVHIAFTERGGEIMRYLKLSLTHLKKNLLPVIIAVLQVSLAVVIINIIFSSVMQTFGMNIFAKGFDDSHLFALTKREMQSVTGMTQEESRQYHAAWENGYAEDMNIPLEEIANYINSYDSYCWRNRHEYSDGTFKEMSYSDIKNLYRENTAEMENIISKNPDVLDCSSIDMLPFEPYENDLFAASYFEIWNGGSCR